MAIQLIKNQESGSKNKALLNNNSLASLPLRLFASKFPLSPTLSHKGRGRRVAFTLAEVLITLGIIGVVAALTLPTLISNHKKSVVETRLKKFYTSINQAIQLAEVDYGDKETWQIRDTQEFWDKYLKPYLNYTKIDDNITLKNMSREFKTVFFTDGSAAMFDIFYAEENPVSSNGGHFLFCPEAKHCQKDVIEENYFNYMGTKCFRFGFWPGKKEYKYHYKKGVEPYLTDWNGYLEVLYSRCSQKNSYSAYCTAIIQQNGWEIPKNYPLKF